MDKRSQTSKLNGKLGGCPKGIKQKRTIEREKALEYINQRVREELEPILDKLFELARKGDKEAVKILWDRGFGKAKESIELSGDPENPIRIIKVREDERNNNPIAPKAV